MAAKEVNERVERSKQAIVNLDAVIKRGIEDIFELSGPVQSLNEASRSVKDAMKRMDCILDELEVTSRVMGHGGDKDLLKKYLDQFRLNHRRNKEKLATAVAFCMQRIGANNRRDLFGTSKPESSASSRFERNFVKESVAATSGLSDLLSRMSEQVKKSEDTLDTLVQSSQTIGATEGEYRSTGAHIKSSSKLLSKYGRREFTDKVLFFLALALYFGTVLYILKKRLFGFTNSNLETETAPSESSALQEEIPVARDEF